VWRFDERRAARLMAATGSAGLLKRRAAKRSASLAQPAQVTRRKHPEQLRAAALDSVVQFERDHPELSAA